MQQPFRVIACHRNEGVFNESRILGDRECEYGSLVVEGEVEVIDG